MGEKERGSRGRDEELVEWMVALDLRGGPFQGRERDVEAQHIAVELLHDVGCEPIDEIAQRLVRREDRAAEPIDSAFPRGCAQTEEKEAPEALALDLVDDGHRRLGDTGLLRQADEARDAHRLAVSGVDRAEREVFSPSICVR